MTPRSTGQRSYRAPRCESRHYLARRTESRQLSSLRNQIAERRPNQPHGTVSAARIDRVRRATDSFAPVTTRADPATVAADRLEPARRSIVRHAHGHVLTGRALAVADDHDVARPRLDRRRLARHERHAHAQVAVGRPEVSLVVPALIAAPRDEAVRAGEPRSEPLRVQSSRGPRIAGRHPAPLRLPVVFVLPGRQ